MILATVPWYDPARIGDRDGRAVVVGSGIADLLHLVSFRMRFDEVTVIDHDPIPDELAPRRGISNDPIC